MTSNHTKPKKSHIPIHSKTNILIPGLPNDLALECLYKVPITCHSTLKSVSHAWHSTITSISFYTDRRRFGFAESLIFLIQPEFPPPQEPPPTTKDHHQHLQSESSSIGINSIPYYNLNIFNLTRGAWHRLCLPVPTFAQCVAVPDSKKVIVLGGWDPQTLEPLKSVFVLDLVTATWKVGSPMITARSFFACTAVAARGRTSAVVYVAGGHDGQKNALRSAEAYDVDADRWWSLPCMSEERDESQGLSFDGIRFWAVSGYGTDSQGRFRSDCEVFDPELGSWSKIDAVWPYPNTTPKSTIAVADHQRQRQWLFIGDGEVKEFEWEEERWKRLDMGQVPKRVIGSSSISMVDVGDGENERVLVMGNGENCEKGECKEDEECCGGEGVFILERSNEKVKVTDKKSGVTNWKHVHAPSRFMGLPFSASQILI